MVSTQFIRFVGLLTCFSWLAQLVEGSSSSVQHAELGECTCCNFPRGGQRSLSKSPQGRVVHAANTGQRGYFQEGRESFSSSSSQPRIQRRRACAFYLWDAPSALLYRWCHHLQRDCIYEGRGGHKFVRIQPGSVLQLLYPCTRYSRDRCLFCGGSFHDHLQLWWSPNLYTPFDLHLDRTRASALTPSTHVGVKKSGKDLKLESKPLQTSDSPRYSFHRRYVLDANDVVAFIQNRKKSINSSKMAADIQRSVADFYNLKLRSKIELRIVDALDDDANEESDQVISYIIPANPFQGSGIAKATFKCTRSLVLFWLDRFIVMQEGENIRLRRNQRLSDDKEGTSRW